MNERIVGRADEGVDVDMPAVGIQRIAFDLADLDAAIVDRRAGADGAELILGQREGAARRVRLQQRRILQTDEVALRITVAGVHLDVGARTPGCSVRICRWCPPVG